MLNKDLCRQCINSFYRLVRWTQQDDLRWSIGEVMCPNRDDKKLHRRSNKVLIEDCPYKFEHAVAAGMRHVK